MMPGNTGRGKKRQRKRHQAGYTVGNWTLKSWGLLGNSVEHAPQLSYEEDGIVTCQHTLITYRGVLLGTLITQQF